MDRVDTDIELLTSAFAYSFALLNEVFYLRKRDLKVVAVYMTDYALVSECRDTYESGLTKEEERDIKEAIIAQEKKYDTHILIPRLTKEERFYSVAWLCRVTYILQASGLVTKSYNTLQIFISFSKF